jgi:transposase-like protein
MYSEAVKIKSVESYFSGMPTTEINRMLNIKGKVTLYGWLRQLRAGGLNAFENQSSTKTYVDYSVKLEIIQWRLVHKASLPETASHFGVRHSSQIWQWERSLKEGRLKSSRGRPKPMSKSKPKTGRQDYSGRTNEELAQENELLRLRIAYLEKLHALVEKKRKSPTEKRSK